MTATLSVLWSITKGAWLTTAVILLARLVFHRVLSAKAKYYLWLLLALRLMLPVLPESPLSLLNLLPDGSTASAVSAAVETPSAAAQGGDTVWQEYDPAAISVPDGTLPASGVVWEAPSNTVDTATILFWVWLGGAGAVLLFYLFLHVLTVRRLRCLPYCADSDTLRVFLRLKRDCGIRGQIRLVSGGGGMLGNLFRPTIVLPAERHGEDAAPILLHELLHYKSHDLWIFALFQLLTALHWFDPVVWLGYFMVKNDSEAACDQRVLETALVQPQQYASVLYEEGVLQMKPGLTLTTFGGSRRSLKRRIFGIAHFHSPRVWVTVLAVVLALAVTACTMTGAISSTASSAGEAAAGRTVRTDFDDYMQDYQPPGGIFGQTYEAHVESGLLDPENGTLASYQNDAGKSFTQFSTSMELGGQTVEICYNFSQTALSDDEILTQVFMTPPEDVPLDSWLESIADPWLGSMTENTDAGRLEWDTQEYVADFLTEEQLQTAAAALAEMSGASDSFQTEEQAEWALTQTWRVVVAFYTEDANLWQFNGTGAALIAAAQDAEAPTEAANNGAGDDQPTLDSTFSPYVLSGGSLTYGDTQWGMTVDEVMETEGLDTEIWKYREQAKSILPTGSPFPDHPEISDVTYTFNWAGAELEFGLTLIIVKYDADQISFARLLAQRTAELGTPDYTDGDKAYWETSGGDQLMLLNGNDTIDERLYNSSSLVTYGVGTLQGLDVEAYMEDLQAPGGHFGWTFQQHVDAGLLDPDSGEAEYAENSSDSYLYFHTTTELGGYQVPISYLFHVTLVSEEPVLTQVFVTPPEDVVYQDWVESFWDPWKNKLYAQSSLQFMSPVMLSNLLTEEQQQPLLDELNQRQDITDASLQNWSLMWCGYDSSSNTWQYNGTGAALYLTATAEP